MSDSTRRTAPTGGEEGIDALRLSWAWIWRSFLIGFILLLPFIFLSSSGDPWEGFGFLLVILAFLQSALFGVFYLCCLSVLGWVMATWGSRDPFIWLIMGGLAGAAYPTLMPMPSGGMLPEEYLTPTMSLAAISWGIGGLWAIISWNNRHGWSLSHAWRRHIVTALILCALGALQALRQQDAHVENGMLVSAKLHHGNEVVPITIAYRCEKAVAPRSGKAAAQSSHTFPLPDGGAALVNFPSPCQNQNENDGRPGAQLSLVDDVQAPSLIATHADQYPLKTTPLLTDITTTVATVDWERFEMQPRFRLERSLSHFSDEEKERLQTFRGIQARRIPYHIWRAQPELSFLETLTQPQFFIGPISSSRDANGKLKLLGTDGSDRDKWLFAAFHLDLLTTKALPGYYDFTAGMMRMSEDGGLQYRRFSGLAGTARERPDCGALLKAISPTAKVSHPDEKICRARSEFYYFDPVDKSVWVLRLRQLFYLPDKGRAD